MKTFDTGIRQHVECCRRHVEIMRTATFALVYYLDHDSSTSSLEKHHEYIVIYDNKVVTNEL